MLMLPTPTFFSLHLHGLGRKDEFDVVFIQEHIIISFEKFQVSASLHPDLSEQSVTRLFSFMQDFRENLTA